MHKTLSSLLMLAAVSLTGCALAPQTVSISEQATVKGKTSAREALVRVVDERGVEKTQLGSRGGPAPERSPLLSDKPLDTVLTHKLQNSLAQLGFGAQGNEEPLKLQLTIEKLKYQCNTNAMFNECGVEIRFLMTVIDGGRTFTKPYGINEVRSLAASPVQEYNQLWMNDVLNRVWQYMFSDMELRHALGVQ